MAASEYLASGLQDSLFGFRYQGNECGSALSKALNFFLAFFGGEAVNDELLSLGEVRAVADEVDPFPGLNSRDDRLAAICTPDRKSRGLGWRSV